jgi:hypothetical protein
MTELDTLAHQLAYSAARSDMNEPWVRVRGEG